MVEEPFPWYLFLSPHHRVCGGYVYSYHKYDWLYKPEAFACKPSIWLWRPVCLRVLLHGSFCSLPSPSCVLRITCTSSLSSRHVCTQSLTQQFSNRRPNLSLIQLLQLVTSIPGGLEACCRSSVSRMFRTLTRIPLAASSFATCERSRLLSKRKHCPGHTNVDVSLIVPHREVDDEVLLAEEEEESLYPAIEIISDEEMEQLSF